MALGLAVSVAVVVPALRLVAEVNPLRGRFWRLWRNRAGVFGTFAVFTKGKHGGLSAKLSGGCQWSDGAGGRFHVYKTNTSPAPLDGTTTVSVA